MRNGRYAYNQQSPEYIERARREAAKELPYMNVNPGWYDSHLWEKMRKAEAYGSVYIGKQSRSSSGVPYIHE